MKIPEILVIGATGRLGTYLFSAWPRSKVRWQTRRSALSSEWVSFDPLMEPEKFCSAAKQVHTILCLAGGVPGRGQVADNVPLALASVEAASESGSRVILASTAAVYGPGDGTPMSETRAVDPGTDYGCSKAEMEHRAAERGKDLGVSVTSLRIGNVAGADACLGGWQPGFTLDTFDDGGTPRRSYIGPQTFARTIWALCSLPSLPALINVASPGVIEMGELLDAAGLGWEGRPAPAHAIPSVELDVSRLVTLIDKVPLSDAVALVQEWRNTAS